MNTVTKTSPQGVDIEMIEAPAAMRAEFAQPTAAGLIVTPVSPLQLSESERRAFGIEGGAA